MKGPVLWGIKMPVQSIKPTWADLLCDQGKLGEDQGSNLGKHVPVSMCACAHVWLGTRAVVGLLLGFFFFLSEINIVVLFFDGLKDMGSSFSQTLFLGIYALSPECRVNKLEILGFKIKINNYCSAFPHCLLPFPPSPQLPSLDQSIPWELLCPGRAGSPEITHPTISCWGARAALAMSLPLCPGL